MTQNKFSRAFALLKVTEGGYVNDPDDPGGATNKGVTHRTYDAYRRRNGQNTRDVRQITDTEVEAIYRGQFWNTIRGDDLPSGIAYCVFDAAVNSGPARAAKWLQQIVGMKTDGVIGTATLAAVRDAEPQALVDLYCDRRLAYMKRLRTWQKYRAGWTNRVEAVRAQSKAWAAQPIVKFEPGPKSRTSPAQSTTVRASAAQIVAGASSAAGSLAMLDGTAQIVALAFCGFVILAAIWIMRERLRRWADGDR